MFRLNGIGCAMNFAQECLDRAYILLGEALNCVKQSYWYWSLVP